MVVLLKKRPSVSLESNHSSCFDRKSYVPINLKHDLGYRGIMIVKLRGKDLNNEDSPRHPLLRDMRITFWHDSWFGRGFLILSHQVPVRTDLWLQRNAMETNGNIFSMAYIPMTPYIP